MSNENEFEPETWRAPKRITEIKMVENGPLIVLGAVSITWVDEGGAPRGQSVSQDRPVALCRCGASGKKPLCDGEHKYCADVHGHLPAGSVE